MSGGLLIGMEMLILFITATNSVMRKIVIVAIMATIFIHFLLVVNKPEDSEVDSRIFLVHNLFDYSISLNRTSIFNIIYFLYFLYLTLFMTGTLKFREIFRFK